MRRCAATPVDGTRNTKMWVTPKIVNRTTTVAVTLCLVIATNRLTHGCSYVETVFVANPQMCATQTNSLFDTSWVLAVLLSAAGVVLITLYAVLDAGGLCVSGLCNNQRSAITLSVLTAIFAGIYADFVLEKLDDVPDTAIDHPKACFLCPNGKSTAWRGILIVGPTTAVMGIFVTFILHCLTDIANNSSSGEKAERLIRVPTRENECAMSRNILMEDVN